MLSQQQTRRFLVTMALTVMLAITIAFDFGTASSWAATISTQNPHPLQGQPATLGKSQAVTKNLEGKSQEAIGKVTGNSKDQVVGKAKQTESQTQNIVEDVKDKIQDIFN